MNKAKDAIMKSIRRIVKLGAGLSVSAISGALILMPPLTIVGIPALIAGLSMTYDGLMKQDLRNNVFKVSMNRNEIIQNPFRIDRFVKFLFGRNKVRNFLNESIDCLTQLDVCKNKEKITYRMKSHGFAKKRLEELQQMGYIENLESKIMFDGEKQSFFLENLAMGNFRQLFKKKEKFEMNFNLTGKKFASSEIEKYIDNVVDRHKKKKSNSTDVEPTSNAIPIVDSAKSVEKKIEKPDYEKESNQHADDVKARIEFLQKRREELLCSKYTNQEQERRTNVR